MPLAWLRPDLPAAYPFTVTQLPFDTKLDQNEAPIDLPLELKRDIAGELAARPWNRYLQPDEYEAARRELAPVFGLPAEAIAITGGGDQAIEAAFLLAGGPGRTARWFEPTYPYIGHAARRTFTGGGSVELGPDVDAAIDAARIDADPAPDLTVLVAPNNPTGGMPAEAAIDAALSDPARALLVDEAYADFSGETRLPRLARAPNLLIARSLSKSALAGVHVGFLAAAPEAVAIVDRLYTAPYHLSAHQLIVARRYRDIRPHVEALAVTIASERERLVRELAAIDRIAPRPSRASFVLFAVDGAGAARALHGHLAAAGIRVRDVGGLAGLEGHLRATVGMPEQNDRLLDAVRAWVRVSPWTDGNGRATPGTASSRS